MDHSSAYVTRSCDSRHFKSGLFISLPARLMNYSMQKCSIFIITSLSPPNKMSSRPPGNVTNRKQILINKTLQTEAGSATGEEKFNETKRTWSNMILLVLLVLPLRCFQECWLCFIPTLQYKALILLLLKVRPFTRCNERKLLLWVLAFFPASPCSFYHSVRRSACLFYLSLCF